MPALVKLVQGPLFRFLLNSSKRTHDAVTLSLGLRASTHFLLTMRELLATQMAAFLRVCLSVLGTSGGPPAAAYAKKEAVLEQLLDLSFMRWFWPELYLNNDCNPEAASLFEELVHRLCECATPTLPTASGVASVAPHHMTGNHVLAMRCVTAGLSAMRARLRRAPLRPQSHLVRARLMQARRKALVAPCVDAFNKKFKKGVELMITTLGQFGTFSLPRVDLKKGVLSPTQVSCRSVGYFHFVILRGGG